MVSNMLSSAMRSSMLPMCSLLMALEITGGALAAAVAVAEGGADGNTGLACCGVIEVIGSGFRYVG